MKIDPKSLRRLRDKQGLTRPQLAERSGINKRTIQRLENEPQQCQKSRKDTLERLAKALGVKKAKKVCSPASCRFPSPIRHPIRPRARPNRCTDRAEGPARLRSHQTPIWRHCH